MKTDLLLLINLFDLYIEDKNEFEKYYNSSRASNYNSISLAMELYLQQQNRKFYTLYKGTISTLLRPDYWSICKIEFINYFKLS